MEVIAVGRETLALRAAAFAPLRAELLCVMVLLSPNRQLLAWQNFMQVSCRFNAINDLWLDSGGARGKV